MKIIMYELLGLVKEGKAPKKIKYGNVKLKYNEGCEDYYPYYVEGLFEYKFGNCKNFLNDEVEIIEESKKIEKIDEILMIDDLIPPYGENEYKAWKNIIIQQNKINELIDEIKKLKGEK